MSVWIIKYWCTAAKDAVAAYLALTNLMIREQSCEWALIMEYLSFKNVASKISIFENQFYPKVLYKSKEVIVCSLNNKGWN